MKLMTVGTLRGGAGATTVAAMAAEALVGQGARVLLLDACPENMLRLFFPIAYEAQDGWAHAPQAWTEQAFEVQERLVLCPFGQPADGAQALNADAAVEFWMQSLPRLAPEFDWVIADIGVIGPGSASWRRTAFMDLIVLNPDIGTHVRMGQSSLLAPESRLLINQFDPARKLSADLVLDWRVRYADQLLPVFVHRDEALHEALAKRMTIADYMPRSAAALDFSALAVWALAQPRLEQPC